MASNYSALIRSCRKHGSFSFERLASVTFFRKMLIMIKHICTNLKNRKEKKIILFMLLLAHTCFGFKSHSMNSVVTAFVTVIGLVLLIVVTSKLKQNREKEFVSYHC